MTRKKLVVTYRRKVTGISPFLTIQRVFQPIPKQQILDPSILKEFAYDNFNENDRKLSKQFENTVGKGEIARYEQFLLFSTVVSKDVHCKHVKTRVCLGKG